jgi:hypothetical protein
MSGRQLRIVPYNGNRAYKYYLDGYKVNGKRKRLLFKDEAATDRKLTELAKQQRKEGQDGLDIPLDLRVMAVKAAKRLCVLLSRFQRAHGRADSRVAISARSTSLGCWPLRNKFGGRVEMYPVN